MAVDSTGPLIIGLTVMFEVIAIAAVSLRFWGQQSLKRNVLAHDIWIVISLICATALSITLILSVVLGGLGQHASQLYATPWKIATFQKILISLQTCWACGMTSVRMSILFLYIRLFEKDRNFRITCYVMLVVNILWFIGEMCVVWLVCQPVAGYWDSSIEAHCGNLSAAYLAVHASNLMVDLLVAGLPVQVLWRLQMPTGKKLGIMAMFALVALICAITVARLVLWRIALGLTSTDFTYTGSTLYLFCAIDVSTACTLACMPLLKPAGQKLASSSMVSWMRTIVHTIQSHVSKASSGSREWNEAASDEGPCLEAQMVGEKNSKSSEGMAANERDIYVDRQAHQHTYLSNDSLEMER